MNKVYEIVTEKIIGELEKGNIPWRQPWDKVAPPINLISKKPYRGINILLLMCRGYSSPYWLTFRQAKTLGGSVRKGEKASLIVFWKWTEKPEEDEKGVIKMKPVPFLRYFTVFNTEQVEGIEDHIPDRESQRPFDPIGKAQEIFDDMPNRPIIQHGRARASYSPALDTVSLPHAHQFESASDYYSVAFHELTHSTGHKSRLDRLDAENLAPFGSEDYSKEELVAELGSAFLCAEAGIDAAIVRSSAAYIQNWLKVLKDDKKMIVFAGARAQKAADLILGKLEQVAEEPEAVAVAA